MKMIGDEVYIQRGENWSLDFTVKNNKGHPFVVLKAWENPYLAITVAAALYEQYGDYRETYWLDLDKRWVEQQDGDILLVPLKRFISAEPLLLSSFTVNEVIGTYGEEFGGNIVLDDTSDFDITNFLFFTDPYSDGNYIYKFVKEYTVDYDSGNLVNEEWEEYDFRIVKQFDTKNWIEQRYFYDIKVLAGQSVQEYLCSILNSQGNSYKALDKWDSEDWQNYIDIVIEENTKKEIQCLYDEGVPLMPTFDIKSLILDPTQIYVSANIQGGIK